LRLVDVGTRLTDKRTDRQAVHWEDQIKKIYASLFGGGEELPKRWRNIKEISVKTIPFDNFSISLRWKIFSLMMREMWGTSCMVEVGWAFSLKSREALSIRFKISRYQLKKHRPPWRIATHERFTRESHHLTLSSPWVVITSCSSQSHCQKKQENLEMVVLMFNVIHHHAHRPIPFNHFYFLSYFWMFNPIGSILKKKIYLK